MESQHDPQPIVSRLDGYIDRADWHHVFGWAHDPSTPDQALWLEALVDHQPPMSFLANMRRVDLVQLGFGHGRFGFDLRFPKPLDPNLPHTLVIRRKSDGLLLNRSPWYLQRAPTAGAEARATFAEVVSAEIEAIQNGAEVDETVSFLLLQVDRLLQGKADSDAGTTALQHFRQRWTDYLPGDRVMPLTPDTRPWALVLDTEMPETTPALRTVRALTQMGYRVAVLATKDLSATSAIAKALMAEGVLVFGMPMYFTVEDVLRRNRMLFRVVVLLSAATASTYNLVARLHQPRARTVTFLGDLVRGVASPVLNLTAALLSDIVIIETEAASHQLGQQIPGRRFHVLDPEAEVSTVIDALSIAGIISPKTPSALPQPQATDMPPAIAVAEPASPTEFLDPS